MAAIFQTAISSAFYLIRMHTFRLMFHWSLLPRVQLTTFQHWFRWWLGAVQATSHYLNQCWHKLPTHICVSRPQWVLSLCRNPLNSSYPSASYMRGELGQCWFRWWLIACSAPSYYPNQYWLIVSWTLRSKFQWNLDQKLFFSFMKIHLKISLRNYVHFHQGEIGLCRGLCDVPYRQCFFVFF